MYICVYASTLSREAFRDWCPGLLGAEPTTRAGVVLAGKPFLAALFNWYPLRPQLQLNPLVALTPSSIPLCSIAVGPH